MIQLITYTTFGAAKLAANWLSSCQKLDIDDRVVIYCGDQEASNSLSKYIQLTNCKTKVIDRFIDYKSNKSVNWGTKEFAKNICLTKLILMWELSLNESFVPHLFCDSDTVLLKNPNDCLRILCEKISNQSLWISSDAATMNETPMTAKNTWNPGVCYIDKPQVEFWEYAKNWLSERVDRVVDISTTEYFTGGYFDGQKATNMTIDHFKLKLVPLTPKFWRNGSFPWEGEMILCHANYIVGVKAKEQKFRDHGFWFADDDILKESGL